MVTTVGRADAISSSAVLEATVTTRIGHVLMKLAVRDGVQSVVLAHAMNHKHVLVAVALALASLCLAPSSLPGRPEARAYYVSSSGDDRGPGTRARPWKTLARASLGRYRAGDRILLEGGKRFVGALSFTPRNARGSAAAPVTVSSYGRGRATIAGALLARNVARIHVRGLRFAGSNPANGGSGIAFVNTSARQLEGIRISDVEVRGYTNPIYVLALKPPAGYRGIRIERASVHDNAQGPVLFGWLGRASTLDGDRFGLEDVVIRRMRSFRNTGAGLKGGHGAGLVVLNADRVLIEDNTIHDNGGDNPEQVPNGPAGITVYDARDVVIQRNEVYRQRYDVKNQTDNSGMDVWARRAVIQYNYVHDNEGWGFVFGSSDPKITGPGASWLSSDVTLRYNLAANNGRPLARSESTVGQRLATVLMFGQIERYAIYNNTFFRAGRAAAGTHPDLVQGLIVLVNVPGAGGPWANVHIRNNVLIAQDGARFADVWLPEAGTDLRFEANAYVSSRGRAGIVWGNELFADVSAWSARTGQEVVDGQVVAAVSGTGALCAVGTRAAGGYRLRRGSALVDRALDLRARLGLNLGRRDFFGNRIPAGRGFDVGAHEYRPGDRCGR